MTWNMGSFMMYSFSFRLFWRDWYLTVSKEIISLFCSSLVTVKIEFDLWHYLVVIVCMLQVRRYIQKFPDWVDNEIYAYNNKNSVRSNTKGYGGKTY
jgi:hypothetical protein